MGKQAVGIRFIAGEMVIPVHEFDDDLLLKLDLLPRPFKAQNSLSPELKRPRGDCDGDP